MFYYLHTPPPNKSRDSVGGDTTVEDTKKKEQAGKSLRPTKPHPTPLSARLDLLIVVLCGRIRVLTVLTESWKVKALCFLNNEPRAFYFPNVGGIAA
jgi:hypothetical protein